jgi:hypothetical protein
VVVPQCNRVNSESGEFFNKSNQRLQVLLDGNVKRITIFEVDRNYEIISDLNMGASLQFPRAEPRM